MCEKVSRTIWRFAWQMMDLLGATKLSSRAAETGVGPMMRRRGLSRKALSLVFMLLMSRAVMTLFRTSFPSAAGKRARAFWHCLEAMPDPAESGDAEPSFVALTITAEPSDAVSVAAVLTMKIGPDVVKQVRGDVPVERVAALVRAMRGTA